MERTHCGDTPGTAAPEEKKLASLKARAALAGIMLHQLADGGFLACRGGWSRDLPDLDRVEAWLNITTGSRA